jgi:hypothetical protein
MEDGADAPPRASASSQQGAPKLSLRIDTLYVGQTAQASITTHRNDSLCVIIWVSMWARSVENKT